MNIPDLLARRSTCGRCIKLTKQEFDNISMEVWAGLHAYVNEAGEVFWFNCRVIVT